MFEKMRQGKENATRIIAVLLSFSAIILGITTPSWADATGSMSTNTWTNYEVGFNVDVPLVSVGIPYSTTVGTSLDIHTNNNTTFNYDIPTPTASVNLGVISSNTTSITFNPSSFLQFATAPTFTVIDNINYTTTLGLSAFGRSVSATLPNYFPSNAIGNTTGSSSLTVTASGPTGPLTLGQANVIGPQTGNTGALWSMSGSLMDVAAASAGGVASLLGGAGVSLTPNIGVGVDGTYRINMYPSLQYPTLTIPINPSPGIHSFTIADPLGIGLWAAANYQYQGDIGLNIGVAGISVWSWDKGAGKWVPDQPGLNSPYSWAYTGFNLTDFTVTGTYEVSPAVASPPISDTQYNSGTLNNTDTLNITGTLNNSGTVNNYGTLNNTGTLNNSGTVNNGYGASLVNNPSFTLNNNAGGTINLYGELDNYSIVNNNYGGTLNNYSYLNNSYYGGTLNNSGTINNSSVATLANYNTLNNNYGGTLNNYGQLCNYSTLNNSYGGTLNNNYNGGWYNYAGGTLNNSGTLNNNYKGWLDNFYTLNNNSGGTLNNSGSLINDYWATLNNSGTLSNNLGGTLTNYAQLTNSGTLNNNVGATLANYGTLNNNSAGTLTNSGTLNNNLGGTLTNSGTLANSGTLNNDGTINGTGTYTQTDGLTKNMGSLSQSSIQINGGILSGTGTITGNVTIGSNGTVQPGDAPGTLIIDGNFSSSGKLLIDIASGSHGVLSIINGGSATFTSGSIIEFDFLDGYVPLAGTSCDFLLAQSITGLEDVYCIWSGLPENLSGEFTLCNGVESLQIVPLPASVVLLGSGLLGLMGFGWRRRRR